MGRPPQVSFRFEKHRLLQRRKNWELWDGWIQENSHLVKRFTTSRPSNWDDFLLQSRLKHSVLLKPFTGGYSKDGSFCFGVPVDFTAARTIGDSHDLKQFTVQLLSLLIGLEKKGIAVSWHPDCLIYDSSTSKVFLSGIHTAKKKPSYEIHQLTTLYQFASKHVHRDEDLLKILRKWIRRKDSQLQGCLVDLLPGSNCIDKTVLVYEWRFTRELELIAGLARLAEERKGRGLIFHGEAGEGKTTMLRQIYNDQIARGSRVVYFHAQKEERPYQSIKNLFRKALHDWGIAQEIPHEITEENLLEAFSRIFSNSSRVSIFLLDGLHDMDVYSRRFVLRLFRNCTELPVIFLATSRQSIKEAADSAVMLPIHKPSLRQMEESVFVPFWQEKQRKSYFEQIYQRTSGNALFFYEFLMEAIARAQKRVLWEQGEWRFSESRAPAFPEALLDFYWNNAPELSTKERNFLQLAAVQGEQFEVTARDEKFIAPLMGKNILVESSGRYRFRNRLFAEAILNKLEPLRLKRIHQELADALSSHIRPESFLMLARHCMKAGDSSHALEWTCKAIRELGQDVEPLALSLLEELRSHESYFNSAEKILLYRQIGDLYHHRGKYALAVESFRSAMKSAGSDNIQRFSIGVSIAECSLLNEDIHSAQTILGDLTALLPSISDERSLFRYYIAKGLYSHYRGPRDASDFQKAFSLAESIGDNALLAHGYRRSARFHLKEGRLAEASTHARRALRFAKMARDTQELGHCYKIFASIAWRKSRHESAEEMMKKSIRAFQKARNPFGSAGVWNLLGNVYVEKYRFAEAIRCFEKAIHLYGHLDHPREVSLAQFNMGLAFLELGRLKEAEKIFLRCREMDRRSGNRWFFAYDLRALAVYCILQGYPKKAEKLLKKTIEICQQLGAEGDILQTKLIFLFLLLIQRKFRDAESLVSFLERCLPDQREPMTEAEIHHLLAFYYGSINEISRALFHLRKSTLIGRRIQHFKLLGKNLILSLIFRGTPPRADDLDFRKAAHYFRKSKNQLEFADYLTLFYQTYPALSKEKLHQKRMRWMESLYLKLQIKPQLQSIRRFISESQPKSSSNLGYEWFHSVLELFSGRESLESQLKAVLQEISHEFDSSHCMVHFLNDSGTFDRVAFPQNSDSNDKEDVPNKIFENIFRRKESICIDVRSDPELSRASWVILHQVRSILAVPFVKNSQLLGFWYLERRADASAFTPRDLQKALLLSRVCLPLLESTINREAGIKREKTTSSRTFEDFVGISRRVNQVSRLIEKVGPLDVSVLIQGESGTGKELVAQNIHRASRRASGPFIALNCSAIPETLIESELFGHSRGAFTGAVAARTGSVERAQGGTLFLDEIGDLSTSAQAKLLRVIQEKEIQRLGETAVRKIDVRFLFATHKDLQKMVKNGQYREDLFYRISGYILSVPPVRDRKEDIPLLTRHFVEKYSRAFGKQNIRFSASVMKLLCDYPWPGNVREMENMIQTVLVNSESNSIVEAELLPESFRVPQLVEMNSGISLEEGREEFDREFVLQALERNRWNKSLTAKELKITRQGLINMIHRLKLEK
jgi:transcriptional regulator with GAF, ATPase, and Fis domain